VEGAWLDVCILPIKPPSFSVQDLCLKLSSASSSPGGQNWCWVWFRLWHRLRTIKQHHRPINQTRRVPTLTSQTLFQRAIGTDQRNICRARDLRLGYPFARPGLRYRDGRSQQVNLHPYVQLFIFWGSQEFTEVVEAKRTLQMLYTLRSGIGNGKGGVAFSDGFVFGICDGEVGYGP